MKVKELISKLKEYDDEMEVFIIDSEWGYDRIKDVTIRENFVIQYPFTNKKDKKIKKGVVLS